MRNMKKHINAHDAAFFTVYSLSSDGIIIPCRTPKVLFPALDPTNLLHYRCTYYVFVSSLVLGHTFRILSVLAITSKALTY
jgi:hypothetical protein